MSTLAKGFRFLWYLQKRGKTEGPIPQITLIHAVKKGDIGPDDLLYKEGDSQWRRVSDFSEFSSLLASSSMPIQEAAHKNWVVLERHPQGQGFRHKGPFSKEEVIKKLQAGEIHWSDYAWTSGMKEWYRLIALLSEEKNEARYPIPIVQVDRDGPNVLLEEAAPPHPNPLIELNSDRQSLETQKVEQKPHKTDRKKGAPKEPQKSEPILFSARQTTRGATLEQLKEKAPSQKFTVTVIMLFTFFTLATASLFWQTYRDHKAIKGQDQNNKNQIQKDSTPPEGTAITLKKELKEELKKQELVAVPIEKKEAELLMLPTQLRLQIHNNEEDFPEIEIITNASSHYSFQLQIQNQWGQVVRQKSFFWRRRITQLEDRVFSTRRIGLQPGHYTVHVEVLSGPDLQDKNRLKAQGRLSVKTKNPQFRFDLAQYKKQLVADSIREKPSLVRLIIKKEEKLEELLRLSKPPEKQPLSKLAYDQWVKQWTRISNYQMKNFSRSTRNNYIYAEQWGQVQELKAKVSKASQDLTSKNEGTRLEALNQVRRLRTELIGVKDTVLALSLFRNP